MMLASSTIFLECVFVSFAGTDLAPTVKETEGNVDYGYLTFVLIEILYQ